MCVQRHVESPTNHAMRFCLQEHCANKTSASLEKCGCIEVDSIPGEEVALHRLNREDQRSSSPLPLSAWSAEYTPAVRAQTGYLYSEYHCLRFLDFQVGCCQ